MIQIKDLGIIDYEDGLKLQHNLVYERSLKKIDDTILVVEHYPVFTLGKHGKEENLLVSKEKLTQLNIKFIRTDRGGDITYHGPGQVVVYPIIDLYSRNIGIKEYVHLLEDAMIKTSKEFGIKAYRVEGQVGVWVGRGKLGAIGVRVIKGITSHGLAYNVNVDLTNFNYINPCGVKGGQVTSLKELLGKTVDICKVKRVLTNYLIELLEGPKIENK